MSYAIPRSQYIDPPGSWQWGYAYPSWWAGHWPYPRMPWPFESETRAPGTGLIWGCKPVCPPPCPPKRCCCGRCRGYYHYYPQQLN